MYTRLCNELPYLFAFTIIQLVFDICLGKLPKHIGYTAHVFFKNESSTWTIPFAWLDQGFSFCTIMLAKMHFRYSV